nr:partitioning defective protein 6 [Hymenolepis microstoma]
MARLAVKSKYNAEFRRFRLDRSHVQRFEDLYHAVEKAHSLQNVSFILQYVDPKESTLLPINNDKNCERALSVASDLLRLLIQLKGESYGEIKGYKSSSAVFLRKKPAELVRSLGSERIKPGHQSIILCDDFHKVSSIIDDGTVPECMRKVRLIRTGSKPLGFYIRDGFSMRATQTGVQRVPGIFISRLLPGGLAESTGLLAVKDEVIEVNGIEVYGKTLDQVTDMMVANSSNLIITVKPFNQKSVIRRSKFMAPVPSGSSLGTNGGGTASPSVHSSQSSGRRQPPHPPIESPKNVPEVPGTIDI